MSDDSRRPPTSRTRRRSASTSGSRRPKSGERARAPAGSRSRVRADAAAVRASPLRGGCRTIPSSSATGDLFRFGLFTLVYAMLGLGLNVVVGFAGLLDLGYVAFYGFGAYTYAILASPTDGWHWPAEVRSRSRSSSAAAARPAPRPPVAPPARRLPRDRHALLRPGVRRSSCNRREPGRAHRGRKRDRGHRPDRLLRLHARDDRQYYCFMLAAFVVVFAALWSLVRSRIGRAWKALREDPLAA